jgi:hypothetical protein
MYYSYVEIDYVATSFSTARTDFALKLLMKAKERLSEQDKQGLGDSKPVLYALSLDFLNLAVN